jgi:hypothetical protein
MIDPLTLILVGAGVLTFREMNRKDYAVLTPSRDERYRNVMEHCYQPDLLLEEAKLFNEYGLKAQAAMLRRRAEWRARPDELKKAHEEVYQKALGSKNIPAILEVAQGFEGWTATKKAANLRDHVREIQETSIQEAAQRAAESIVVKESPKKNNGAGDTAKPFTTEVIDTSATVIGDDI